MGPTRAFPSIDNSHWIIRVNPDPLNILAPNWFVSLFGIIDASWAFLEGCGCLVRQGGERLECAGGEGRGDDEGGFGL